MRDLAGSIIELKKVWATHHRMHKSPDDVKRYEILIDRVKPAVVVETGLLHGGSHQWFADRVPHIINIDSDVQAVQDFRYGYRGMGEPPSNGHIIFGDSCLSFPQVKELAERLANGGAIMVVLDSDHSTGTVYSEMCLYSGLVTVGSYMVVEDGILHFMPKGNWPDGNWFDGDPLEAINRWLPDHPEFREDAEIEDLFPTTQHPRGFLRRMS